MYRSICVYVQKLSMGVCMNRSMGVHVSKVHSIRGTTLPVNRRCALVQTKAQIAVKANIKYYILLYA